MDDRPHNRETGVRAALYQGLIGFPVPRCRGRNALLLKIFVPAGSDAQTPRPAQPFERARISGCLGSHGNWQSAPGHSHRRAEGRGHPPYGLAGLGVVRSKVDALGQVLSFDNSEAAWDFGGGVMFFFGTNVGVRGDLRYFRTFGEVSLVTPGLGKLDFARGSAGLILRF
jgi:hypothetical protein